MYSGTKIAKASHLRPYTREDSPLTEGKELALSRRFLSSSGGRSAIPAKKKSPSRSGLPLSRHVVLTTTHVNPMIHVRRHEIYVRRRNLSTTRPRLLFALVGSHSTTALSFSLRRDESHIARLSSVYRKVLFSGIADYKFFFRFAVWRGALLHTLQKHENAKQRHHFHLIALCTTRLGTLHSSRSSPSLDYGPLHSSFIFW